MRLWSWSTPATTHSCTSPPVGGAPFPWWWWRGPMPLISSSSPRPPSENWSRPAAWLNCNSAGVYDRLGGPHEHHRGRPQRRGQRRLACEGDAEGGTPYASL